MQRLASRIMHQAAESTQATCWASSTYRDSSARCTRGSGKLNSLVAKIATRLASQLSKQLLPRSSANYRRACCRSRPFRNVPTDTAQLRSSSVNHILPCRLAQKNQVMNPRSFAPRSTCARKKDGLNPCGEESVRIRHTSKTVELPPLSKRPRETERYRN